MQQETIATFVFSLHDRLLAQFYCTLFHFYMFFCGRKLRNKGKRNEKWSNSTILVDCLSTSGFMPRANHGILRLWADRSSLFSRVKFLVMR